MGPTWAPHGPPTAHPPKRLYFLMFLLPPLLQTSSPCTWMLGSGRCQNFLHQHQLRFSFLHQHLLGFGFLHLLMLPGRPQSARPKFDGLVAPIIPHNYRHRLLPGLSGRIKVARPYPAHISLCGDSIGTAPSPSSSVSVHSQRPGSMDLQCEMRTGAQGIRFLAKFPAAGFFAEK